MPKPVYPGVIERQGLVDFCQSFLPELQKKQAELSESIDMFTERGDIHTVHALYEGLQESYGFQKALRAVCEWAKENLIEEPPIEAVDPIDIVAERKRLKEHFTNG